MGKQTGCEVVSFEKKKNKCGISPNCIQLDIPPREITQTRKYLPCILKETPLLNA